MERTDKALMGHVGRKSAGFPTALALVAAGFTAAAAPSAHADGADCAAVNNGALNIELDSQGSETRKAVLKAGDTLTFRFEAAPGPFGTLTLLGRAGARRWLLVGPSGTSVSFTAAKAGAFDFEFSRDGAVPAAFAASCTPAPRARRDAALSPPRRTGKAAAEALSKVEDLEAAEFSGFNLETAAPPAAQRTSADAWADGRARPARAPSAPAGAVNVEMQWHGERYKADPIDGSLEVDTAATGVNAAMKYKLLPEIMIGALAQVDQPSETLIGTSHNLLEQGWMVGPVTNIKLSSGLTLDARAAWGAAESTSDGLSPHTAAIPRRMVSARLANTQSFGPWRLTPSVSVNQFYEAPATLAPGVGETVVPYAVPSGRIDVGPELAYRMDLDGSVFIEPKAAIGSFWGIDSLTRLAPGTVGHNEMRLKAEAGVTIGTSGGSKLQAGGGVEEGEPGARDVWTGRLQLSVPMP